MTILIQRFDDISDDFNDRNGLPHVDKIGVGARMHDALDRAAKLRQIVAVIGPKGIGKSHHLDGAAEWFTEREARLHAKNSSYAPKALLVVKNLRHDSYEDILITLLHMLDKRVPVRDNGRRRPTSVLRDELAKLLLIKRVAVIAIDEAEVFTARTMHIIRDVVALTADLARQKQSERKGEVFKGVGALIVGSPDSANVIRQSDEFGQRIVALLELPAISIADATKVLGAWLPAAEQLKGDDAVRWQTFVRVNVCQEQKTTMRHLKDIVEEYARRLDRAQRLPEGSDWADVPIDFALLSLVAQDILPPDFGNGNRKGSRGR